MSDTICSDFGETLSFLWIEFMDPQDGLGFASSAKVGTKKMPALINLLDCAKSQKANLSALPIPRKLSNVKIKNSGTTPDLLIYEFSLGNLSGKISYSNKRIWFAGQSSTEPNDTWYNSPEIDTAFGILSPNIYIISGHGSQGRVYGDGDKVGGIYLHSLKPAKNMKILIVPACSIINYSRGFRLKKLLEDNSMFAILGYENTYEGSNDGFKVMHKFVEDMMDGEPILKSWRLANEAKGLDLYPWSALVCPAANSAHEKFTLSDLIRQPDLIKNKDTAPIFYSDTYKNGRTVQYPPISAFFLEGKSSHHATLSTMVITKDDDALFARLDKKWISSGSKKIFAISSSGQSQFEEGDCLAFLFYVVRPDWEPINLNAILTFVEADIGGFATAEVKIQNGKPILFVKILRSTKHVFLKASIAIDANVLLDKAAFKNGTQNPSDLLCHCIKGKINNKTFSAVAIHESGSKSVIAKFNIDKLGAETWMNKPYSLDLRIFPSKFTVQTFQSADQTTEFLAGTEEPPAF